MSNRAEAALLHLGANQTLPVDTLHHFLTEGMTYERLQQGDFVMALLNQIADVRTVAYSYRDFCTAAGAIVINEDRPKWGRVFGYNFKLNETDELSIHAEEIVHPKAQRIGRIAVLGIVAPFQPDDTTGRATETLLPCYSRCLPMLANSPIVDPTNTVIVTSRADFTAIELSTITAIQTFYRTGDRSGIISFTYPQPPAVFQPIDLELYMTPGGALDISRLPEVDDSDWQSTVGRVLLERSWLPQST